MAVSLPTVISEYFAASERDDVDAVVACFTNDAIVIDEDREWRGLAGVRQWRDTVATVYEYTLEVRAATARGDDVGVERHDVVTHLEGNFPGGTVDLTYRIALSDGRIADLEIVPTEASS